MDLATAIDLRNRAQAAYQDALASKSLSFDSGTASRAITTQDIDKLLAQYQYWDGVVTQLSQQDGVNRMVAIATWRR